jgi:hypothetical protein
VIDDREKIGYLFYVVTQPDIGSVGDIRHLSSTKKGSFFYTADWSVHGNYETSFTYRVYENGLYSNPATVTIKTVGARMPPVAETTEVHVWRDDRGYYKATGQFLASDPQDVPLTSQVWDRATGAWKDRIYTSLRGRVVTRSVGFSYHNGHFTRSDPRHIRTELIRYRVFNGQFYAIGSLRIFLRVGEPGLAKPVASADEDLEFAVGNYPNPFNPETTIRYVLPGPASVRLSIFNMLGQRVHTLVDAEQSQGIYRQVWDGRNQAGDKVGSGIYIYRLEAGEHKATGKMFMVQ